MKKLFFIFSLFVSCACFAQGDDFMLKDNLDRLPDNVGGKLELQRFFEAHVIYPEQALKEKKEGTVKLKFIVLANGKGVKPLISESAGTELDNEALRLFRMLEWLPGEKQGEKVNAFHYVSFVFDIDKYKKYTHARGFTRPKFDKKTIVDTTYTLVDRPDKTAEYYKGDLALTEYIQTTLDYPKTAKLQNISGIVQLSFIVEVDGRISNIIIEKSVSGGCNEEAITLMGDTKWKPAVYQGKLVRSRYKYAIQFSLDNSYKSNEMGEQK